MGINTCKIGNENPNLYRHIKLINMLVSCRIALLRSLTFSFRTELQSEQENS
jgi:hypothetical protein